jgi:D-xylose transport system permease protein
VTDTSTEVLTDFAIDTTAKSLGDVFSDTKARFKSGNLGSLPSILAIITLGLIFTYANKDAFLTTSNLANLMGQASAVIVIAMAVTFVLLLGEIDLAAGFTAGVGATVMATRLANGWPLWQALLMAAIVATALGMFTGFMVAKVGIPSFVVTLANFLSFQGILLLLVKDEGTLRIESVPIKALVGGNLTPTLSWVCVAIGLAYFGWTLWRKKAASHGAIPTSLVAIKLSSATVAAVILTALLNRNRAFERAKEQGTVIEGIPYVVPAIMVILVLLTFLLTRTQYGRHLMAVGGNPEAARRAGINVQRIRLSAFALCGFIAGVGGIFLASFVDSVDPKTGANDTLLLAVGAAVIGGTSLFGGHGRILNAVLGGIVLALIPNGLPLVGQRSPFGITEIDFSSSGVKFICAGLALLAASSVDALSRKAG